MIAWLGILKSPLAKWGGIALVTAAILGGTYLKGYNAGKDSVNLFGQIQVLEAQLEAQKMINHAHADRLRRDESEIRTLEEKIEGLENESNDVDVCVSPDSTRRLRNIFETNPVSDPRNPG